MTWRNNAICTTVLSDNGYFTWEEDEEPELGTLLTKLAADKLVKLFKRNPVLSSQITALNRDTVVVERGLTSEDLIVHMVGREWYDETSLTEAEVKLLKSAKPDEQPELRERNEAIMGLTALFWSTLARDGKEGEVQKRLVSENLLLIEVKRSRKQNLKLATNDSDLIIEHFVEPRGDKVVTLSTKVGGDCRMVAAVFPEMLPTMKKALGAHLTTSLSQLLPVAEPDTTLLFGPASIGPATK